LVKAIDAFEGLIVEIRLAHVVSSFRLATNGFRLPVVGIWNTQLPVPTNVYLKIQMFVSKAKEK